MDEHCQETSAKGDGWNDQDTEELFRQLAQAGQEQTAEPVVREKRLAADLLRFEQADPRFAFERHLQHTCGEHVPTDTPQLPKNYGGSPSDQMWSPVCRTCARLHQCQVSTLNRDIVTVCGWALVNEESARKLFPVGDVAFEMPLKEAPRGQILNTMVNTLAEACAYYGAMLDQKATRLKFLTEVGPSLSGVLGVLTGTSAEETGAAAKVALNEEIARTFRVMTNLMQNVVFSAVMLGFEAGLAAASGKPGTPPGAGCNTVQGKETDSPPED